jgi:hypothetical protein
MKSRRWESLAVTTSLVSSCIAATHGLTHPAPQEPASDRRVAEVVPAVRRPAAPVSTPADGRPTLRVLAHAGALDAPVAAPAAAGASPGTSTHTLEDRYIVRTPRRDGSALTTVYGGAVPGSGAGEGRGRPSAVAAVRGPAASAAPDYGRPDTARRGYGDSDVTDTAGHGRSGRTDADPNDAAGRGRTPPAPPVMVVPSAPAPVTAHVTAHVTLGVAPATGAQTLAQQNSAPAEALEDPLAGRLTAASVGDTDRRANYLGFLRRNAALAASYELDLARRVRVRVLDATDHAVHDAVVHVTSGAAQAEGRTHADGYWDFYPDVLLPGETGAYQLSVEAAGLAAHVPLAVPPRGDGPELVVRLPAAVVRPALALDLGFVIDATGSMGDELSYIDHEVVRIVDRIRARAPGVSVRVGATFYRDRDDDVSLMSIPFSGDVQGFAEEMSRVHAEGGGDYPEDMNAGLHAALQDQAWREGPAVRVLVLIADAPPQPYADENFTHRTAALEASRRGIRLLTVAASGADGNVEFLFRAMGALTSTPYVHLTDDSGIGGSHREADTDRIAVERFNDLLTRLVLADLAGQGMHEPGSLGTADGPPQPAQ